jgi:hypothetical protein
MLVDAAQKGALLGRAGQVISEVRRSSGAHVRVSDARDEPSELPPFAASDDAVMTVRYLLCDCSPVAIFLDSPGAGLRPLKKSAVHLGGTLEVGRSTCITCGACGLHRSRGSLRACGRR